MSTRCEFLSTFILQLEIRGDCDLKGLDSIFKRLDPHSLTVGKRCQRRERRGLALQHGSRGRVRPENLRSLRGLGRPIGRGWRSAVRLLRATVAQHRDQTDDYQFRSQDGAKLPPHATLPQPRTEGTDWSGSKPWPCPSPGGVAAEPHPPRASDLALGLAPGARLGYGRALIAGRSHADSSRLTGSIR